MIIFKAISLLLCTSFVMTQKSPYAGRPALGLLPAFRQNQSDLENRFNAEELTTPLPSELKGTLEEDKLVSRVSQWPEEKQPFWFKNREVISQNRERPVDGQQIQSTDVHDAVETEKRGWYSTGHYQQPTKYNYHAKEHKQQEFNKYIEIKKMEEEKRIIAQQQKELQQFLEQQRLIEEEKLRVEKERELQKYLEAQRLLEEERIKQQQEKELKAYLEKQRLIEEKRLQQEKEKKLQQLIESMKVHEDKSKQDHKYHQHVYHHPPPPPPPAKKIPYSHYQHSSHW